MGSSPLRLLVFLACLWTSTGKIARGKERPIQIINDFDFRIEVYWVHPQTREESLMSAEVLPGTDFKLNSFVDHEFIAREKPTKSGTCKSGDCKSALFKVSHNDEQIIRIDKNFTAIFEDNAVRATKQASEILVECQEKHSSDVNALVKCVEDGVVDALSQVQEEIAYQASVRRSIAANLENYTCADWSLESSEDILTEKWRHNGVVRVVHKKHERPASRIHVIEKFIDEEECKAMEEAAKKKLHRATVADGKGGSTLSLNRKALQAGIKVHWEKEKDGDPIARLSRRVYDYTNHVLGLDIKHNGQEDLMSIQYEGRGLDDKEPDQYTPHCDGDCTGLPHKDGQRMATMVMYCSIPEKGGHTNFRNAGVHVKPVAGDAIFFSYVDPDTMIMDTGFTEHSGCPVYEGSKKIVTQWIRYGVSDETPWDGFNTLGIKISEILDDTDYEPVPEKEEEDSSEDDSEDEEDHDEL